MSMAVGLLVVAVACMSVAPASAYVMVLGGGAEECFYEQLVENEKIQGGFEVVAGGYLDIDAAIYGPSGTVHYTVNREREGKFLPASQPARAEVMQWLMAQMANYGPLLGQLNHFSLVLKPGTEPYAEGRYRAAAEKLYRVLNERLSTREWLAGGAYSIADMAMQPWANYLEWHGFDPEAHPALVEWRTRILDRPATQRALARVAADFNPEAERTRKASTSEDLDRFFGRTEKVPEADFSMVKE